MAAVTVGLVSVGLGSAASLAAGARAMTTSSFAVFATWWTVASLLGLAFVVVEMYMPRLLLAVRSDGGDDLPVVCAFSRGVLIAVVVLSCALAGSTWWIVPKLFGRDVVLLVLVGLYALAMALQTLQRAAAVGRGQFIVYTAQMGTDGLLRLVGCVGAAAMGATSPRAFAGVLVVSAAMGVVSGAQAGPDWWAWRGAQARVEVVPLVLLTLASLGPLVTNNAGVPWLAAVDGVPAATIGAVAGALTLSRIPTLFVGVAYGPLLAPLSRAVESRRRSDFRRTHFGALAASALLAVLFVAVFALSGPRLLELYLGPEFALTRWQLAALAGGSGLMFVCVVEQAALAALSSWAGTAGAWAAGLLVFAGTLGLPVEPDLRVCLAVLMAPASAALVMALVARAEERSILG